jgi:hypothetical protein
MKKFTGAKGRDIFNATGIGIHGNIGQNEMPAVCFCPEPIASANEN